MRILVVGDFGSPQREEAIMEGFLRCNCVVRSCSYGDLLYDKNIFTRLQFKISFGPIFSVLTERVICASVSFRPDVIFFRRPLEFSLIMLSKISAAYPTILASFNNDDPFSSSYNDVRWRLLRKAIPQYDIHFAFRESNVAMFYNSGAKRVSLWEPFFTPWIHFPVSIDSADEDFSLLFAMHAEADERRDALHSLLDAGFPVRVHSWNWSKIFGESDSIKLNVSGFISGAEYRNAIHRASAVLCFFSKQNNDELTSRVFEIPACGGLLLAWRNTRLMQLFKDREEAFFFSSVDELLEIAHFLSKNPRVVQEAKLKGRARLLESRCSVVDRCEDALTHFKQLS